MQRATYPAPALAVVHATCVFIPPITDPLGRSWRQPDLTDVTMDDTHVMLTKRQFDELADYSTTWPTGVYPGKCWKARMAEDRIVGGQAFMAWSNVWMLRWFGECADPTMCSNNQREIIIID
jgi:hypothetical protein